MAFYIYLHDPDYLIGAESPVESFGRNSYAIALVKCFQRSLATILRKVDRHDQGCFSLYV